jgi:hypothetical protein
VLRLLGLELAVPDRTTLSRRGRGFGGHRSSATQHGGPIHLVLDSTGLQLFGQGEWGTEKHGRAHRQWRKLHLAADASTGEIAAHMLTEGNADDAAPVLVLLNEAQGNIASVTAGGAYDSEPVYQACAARQSNSPAVVIIPPRISAMPSTDNPAARSRVVNISNSWLRRAAWPGSRRPGTAGATTSRPR